MNAPTSSQAAIARSVGLYLSDRTRRDALDRWYARFVQHGDLAFDIGAHVGDRSAAFLRLGARVVACEPQPALARFLRRAIPGATILPCAVGAGGGRVTLHVNEANPTVSTASPAFMAAAASAPGWDGQAWTRSVSVPGTTLRALVSRFGDPAFVKIDVEGFEDSVLAGLGRAVPALSFEFTTIQREVAHHCLDRLAALGYRHFNASLGETMRFALPRAVAAPTMRGWIDALPTEANSGDIYAATAAGQLRG